MHRLHPHLTVIEIVDVGTRGSTARLALLLRRYGKRAKRAIDVVTELEAGRRPLPVFSLAAARREPAGELAAGSIDGAGCVCGGDATTADAEDSGHRVASK